MGRVTLLWGGGVYRECEKFKLKELTLHVFKCLIFVQEQTVSENGEIRTRSLSLLEQNPKINQQMIAEECERLENVRYNSTKIKEHDLSKINAIRQKQERNIYP